MDAIATHYAYRPGPDGLRVAVMTFDLTFCPIEERRTLIDQLLDDEGACLCKLPDHLKHASLTEIREWDRNEGR